MSSKKHDIQRLALMLEGDRPATAEASNGERALGGLATLLRESQPVVEPMRPEFRAELRAQVVEAARARTAEPALLTRLRERVERFKYSTGLATATGFASVSIAGGGVAGAAEHAEPGDLLYGTKLAIEDARLLVDTDAATRGRRALSYAGERMAEAQAAAARGDMDGAEAALRSAAERTQVGRESIIASGDDTALLDLIDALTAQSSALQSLAPALTGGAAEAAADLVRDVDAGLLDATSTLQGPPAGPAPTYPTVESQDQTPGAPPAGTSQPDGDGTTPPADTESPVPTGPADAGDDTDVIAPVDVPDVDLPPVTLPDPDDLGDPAPPPVPGDEVDASTATPSTPDALDLQSGAADLLDQASRILGEPTPEGQ